MKISFNDSIRQMDVHNVCVQICLMSAYGTEERAEIQLLATVREQGRGAMCEKVTV